MSIDPGTADSSDPAISVGMPVYNSEAWIEQAIDSILGQSLRDLELIISDNASTDGTYAICERYARQDSRIRLYRNSENIGANRNYLIVLAQARAPYFKWASSNDICAPSFLEVCVAALEREPSAVLAFTQTSLFEADISDAKPYDSDLVLLSEDGGERFVALFGIRGLNNAFNGVVRTAPLQNAAPMGDFYSADIPLMAELALQGKFLLIEQRLFFRRFSRDSATKLKSQQEIDRHLAPYARRPLRWQTWRYYLALLRAAWRHGPFSRISMVAMSHVLKQMLWSRRLLAQDLWQAFSKASW